MSKTEKSFESSLEELEKIVTELEAKDLNLEKSLEKFEKGVKLYKDCKSHLDKVEKKISKLSDSLEEEILSDN